MYKIYITDTQGEYHSIKFIRNEYANLMELLINKLYEDIGDCKGRSLCGTCHIRIMTPNTSIISPDALEQKTLNNQWKHYQNSRLACQIFLNEHINETHFEIVGRD
ncbi:2Fe-2S iron-sulfur cluster-binding protein [Aquimarina sp. 2201CG5-10]|uniref:2Fe-2S iron-sulfur cluster-binding protein n=1 Tax=Aquimarina callyspongiae TaxID=3098150 RepID=UPI002AB5AD02|nr:2Fe-2S iron-sulfur cluster-binding protein [Aquimarina sp. 2201CG5-10]MDY8138441.1 2Fe-2S iron-sulfur cluster-binding protein [Aquimarina sp. 2201CG5-10]